MRHPRMRKRTKNHDNKTKLQSHTNVYVKDHKSLKQGEKAVSRLVHSPLLPTLSLKMSHPTQFQCQENDFNFVCFESNFDLS